MQRRNFPSILLYSFGLALTLSLGFNGYLLREQTNPRSIYESESGNAANPVEHVVWQQQLSDCERANQQKDSLINRLEKAPGALPGQPIIVQRTSTK